MVELSGETFKIILLEPSICPPGTIPDDGFKYKLEGSIWSWASSMFETSTKSKNKKSKTKISFHKKRKIQFDFSL
ncbi:hypothetical protein [Lachnospira sp.]|uniref:hypothetical protein n=1 Tax=Lachnospira sp. TaxID=2049031 RepID=UPI00257B59A3|nr:hypothetical protein [Lachnospira sp.]